MDGTATDPAALDSLGLVLAVLLTGLAGFAVPWLIAHVPEPAQTAGDPAQMAEEPPKLPYAEVAAAPGLALRCATLCLAAAAAIGWGVGWEPPLVYLLPLVPLLVALSAIDFATRLLPTVLIRPCYLIAVAGVVGVWLFTRATDDLVRAGAGWLIAGLVFFVLWFVYPRGMGFGDVRLSGVLGIALGSLGWGQLWVGLYAGFLLFGVPGLVLAVARRDRSLLKVAYPFGPFMVLGALVGVLWGEPLWGGLVGR